MDKKVIRWKLNEVMARKRIRNKDLAAELKITENSVYRLRKTDLMPRLTPERLNGICAALNCQPGELLVWEPANSGDKMGHLDKGNVA
jgi:putative transcriptional regulator